MRRWMIWALLALLWALQALLAAYRHAWGLAVLMLGVTVVFAAVGMLVRGREVAR